MDEARALHGAGRLDQAAALLRARLDADPADAEALHLLGLNADARGDAEQALALIGRALSLRETARFRCNQAMVLLRAGRAEEARASAARALLLRPDYPEALVNLGVALESLGRAGEAANAFRRATILQPGRVEAWLNLGNALRASGDAPGSEAAFQRAITLGPVNGDGTTDPRAWLSLTVAFRQLRRLEEAEAACREALRLAPNHKEVLGSLGSLLGEMGRLAEAEAAQRRALALKPDHVTSYNDLAITLAGQDRPIEALAVLDLALALDPADAEVRQHRAFVLLLLGRLPEGWADYEARFRTRQGLGDGRGFTQPLWRGEALDGRTLLLHAEQGLGDTLQFCRYVPLVAARAAAEGGRVVLEVQPALLPLLRRLPGLARCLPRGETLPPFDLHCPLLSLPAVFGTALDTVPPPAPLAPTPEAAARWRDRLPPSGGRRVAVAWAGNPRHPRDRHRSLPFAALVPLWAVPGIGWHAVQVGPRAADLAGFGQIKDLSPDLADFDDTAAALLCMEAVVTPDTAVAHLAGTLGVPVLLLLPSAPDWRWLRGRPDSPWYPSVRVLRQAAPGDWGGPVAEAAAILGGAAHAG